MLRVLLWLAVAASSPASTPPQIELVVAAPEDGRAVLEGNLHEFLDDLPAHIRFRPATAITPDEVIASSADGVFARVWIDASAGDGARIYIVDATSDRILIRKLELPVGIDEVAANEVAYIIESSLEALLQGGMIGIARQDAERELGLSPAPTTPAQPAAVTDPDPSPKLPRPADPPFPPQTSRPAGRIIGSLGGGYAARAWGTGLAQHGPILDALVAWRWRRLAIGGATEVTTYVPIRSQAAELDLTMSGGGFRFLTHIEDRIAPRWIWQARIGAGIDLVRDAARPRSDMATAADPATRVIALFSARTGPGAVFGRGPHRGWVRLWLTLDVELKGVRYVTSDGQPVFAPWYVRPGALLVIGWEYDRGYVRDETGRLNGSTQRSARWRRRAKVAAW